MVFETKAVSNSVSPPSPVVVPMERLFNHRVVLEIVPPEKPKADTQSKIEDAEPILTTREKVIQIAAYSLIAIGAIILIAASSMIMSGILAGGGATLLLAESLYPIGMISLVAGVHLFGPPKDLPKVTSSLRFGPMTLSV